MTRSSIAWREAWRTTVAHPWRLLLGMCLTAGAMGSVAAIEAATAASAMSALAADEAKGSNVFVIRDEAGPLDGRQCESLGSLAGVRSAGGVSVPVVDTLELAAVSVRTVSGTTGYLHILGYQPGPDSQAQAVAGPSLREELGVLDGSQLEIGDGGTWTVDVLPQNERASDRSRWITYIDVAPSSVGECWIEVERGMSDVVKQALPAAFSGAERLRMETLGAAEASDTVTESWATRPTRFGWIGAAFVACIAIGSLLVTRRPEYALYRLVGISRRWVWLVAALEGALIVTAGLALSLLIQGVLRTQIPLSYQNVSASAGLTSLLLSASAAYLMTTSLACLVTAGNVAHVIRTRK
ncbi:hypothetical protein [Microbacterium sp. NPDC058389]|uniref:hypothetical protein n=1 Tax=Microbacterium sp. NPDC058389 TaxID=3346475 RepID=UPI00365B47BA